MITISFDETAHPGQPDGIADDSNDLPHPADAAERVRAFIEATGDGLYDSSDGHPLYARDLASIRRAAVASLRADLATPYRLSPDGVLVERHASRGVSFWRVLCAPMAVPIYVGQHLTDQHVAGWDVLVRRGGASA